MADTSSSRPARRRFAPHVRASLALGSIAVASLGLTACDSPPPSPPQLQDARFTTVSECVNAGFPDRLCEAGYSAAWQNYQETAPKFTTNQSCEEEWGTGKCVTLTPEPAQVASASSGSVFVPMLALGLPGSPTAAVSTTRPRNIHPRRVHGFSGTSAAVPRRRRSHLRRWYGVRRTHLSRSQWHASSNRSSIHCRY